MRVKEKWKKNRKLFLFSLSIWKSIYSHERNRREQPEDMIKDEMASVRKRVRGLEVSMFLWLRDVLKWLKVKKSKNNAISHSLSENFASKKSLQLSRIKWRLELKKKSRLGTQFEYFIGHYIWWRERKRLFKQTMPILHFYLARINVSGVCVWVCVLVCVCVWAGACQFLTVGLW